MLLRKVSEQRRGGRTARWIAPYEVGRTVTVEIAGGDHVSSRNSGVLGKLPTLPLFDISHSLVTPADACFHRMSLVPSPLKSAVAITFHPWAPGVPGKLPTPPLADISHSLVTPEDAFFHKSL